MVRRLAPVLLALAVAAGASARAAAQAAGEGAPGAAADAESWSGEMIDELMSPYCPGRTLRNCPSSQAGELIGWIEAQDAQGRERDAVFQQLLSEYGEEIRQAPVARGWGATAYVIPVLAFLAGGVLLAVFLRRQGGGALRETEAPAAARPPPPGDSELERLVDEELGRTR
jgi:cytochrome c-type biogenesis protein CcmH/NrfF